MSTSTDKAVLAEILSDPIKYIETFISIQNKEKQTVPFLLNPLQHVLAGYMQTHPRIIIVKARQMGCSTLVIAHFLAVCETSENTVATEISHEEFATQQLLKKAKFMESSIPDKIKLPTKHRSSYEITWEDTNSSFYIGSAKATVIGRGDTIHLLHMSEPAFYTPADKADALVDGASEAVPASGLIVQESTPNGRAGKFYETYRDAKEGENNYLPLFFPWWFDSSYREPYGSINVAEKYRFHVEPDEEESDLMSLHGLIIDQIRWRRGKKSSLKGLFRQEYPENDVDCWLVKGTAALPTESLLAMATKIRKPMEIHPGVFEEEGVRKWRNASGGTRYIVVVDAAKGLPTSDPSVAVVLDLKDCTHVATLRGKFPTDIMAQRTARLALSYGKCPVVVEREGYGDAVIKFLLLEGYDNIYKHVDGKYGFPMAARGQFARNYVLEQLSSSIRTNTLQSWDDIFINEALDFQIIDGKAQAPAGGHDDVVMAMAIGVTVAQIPSYRPGGIKRHRSSSYVPAGVL